MKLRLLRTCLHSERMGSCRLRMQAHASQTKPHLLRTLLLSVCLCLVLAPCALAADDDNKDKSALTQDLPENLVNPQQLPDSSFIYDTDIYALNTSDTYYEDQTVQVTGEIVGDKIRGEATTGKCWLTLSALPEDTPSTVQLYVSESDANKVDTFGRYGQTGSTVVAMGTYHVVCQEHDGLSDLHVDVFTVSEPGSVKKQAFNFVQFGPGVILVAIGLGLVIYYRYVRRSML